MTAVISVYRAFGDDGSLLYVGRTNNLPARLRAHRREKPWWPSVNRWTVENFDNPESAAMHETVAIQTEAPKHNVQHAGRMVPLSFRAPLEAKEAGYAKAERLGLNPTEVMRELWVEWVEADDEA